MASKKWNKGSPLANLTEKPSAFDLLQAIFLLENYLLSTTNFLPTDLEKASNKKISSLEETVRFKLTTHLHFSREQIEKLTIINASSQPRVHIAIHTLGLVGNKGSLPTHYTELLLKRIHKKDFLFQNFLNIFHNQLICLYYRAWQKNNFVASYYYTNQKNQIYLQNILTLLPHSLLKYNKFNSNNVNKPAAGQYGFSKVILSLLGFNNSHLLNKHLIDDETFIYYSSLLLKRPLSADHLAQLLTDFHKLPIEILPFQPDKIILSSKAISLLGKKIYQHNQIGLNLMIGRKYWCLQHKFIIFIAVTDYEKYQSFLPNGINLLKLCQLVHFAVGLELKFAIKLHLPVEHIPALTIARKSLNYLGWNTWLKSRYLTKNMSSLLIDSKKILKKHLFPQAIC